MALPTIDNLARRWPESHISVWCGPHSQPVFEAHGRADRIVRIPNVPGVNHFPRLVQKLMRASTDRFFVLDRSRLIDLACRFAGCKVSGTIRSHHEGPVHEIDCYLSALAQAGVDAPITSPSLTFDVRAVQPFLHDVALKPGEFVTLHPGGAENPGAHMHSKRWPVAHWKTVIHWLETHGLPVMLTGSRDEAVLCREVADGTQATVVAGRASLLASAAIAGSGAAFVGPDTGLTHMVAATSAPTIAIFGPTNPRQYAPRGTHVTTLAPESSYEIRSRDLRLGQRVTGPQTSAVAPDEVIAALSGYLNAGTSGL